jgi:hypothetical protein
VTKHARQALLCGLLATLLVGCRQEPEKPHRGKAVLPNAAPVVVVTMRDYRFDYDPTIPSGRVVFRLLNKGMVPHRPSLLPLPENLPPIDKQLRGAKRRAVSPFAGVQDRRPGASGSFAVDLAAGRRYALVCYARDRDGSSHALKGMASEFRARPRRERAKSKPRE